MTDKELKDFLKNAKPLQLPKIVITVQKTCQNCKDNIICYGLEEPPEDTKKAEKCPDWHLSFSIYQDLLEKQIKSIREEQNQQL